VGAPLYDEVGQETSLAASFQALSSEGVAAFNAEYTDQVGVRYASVAGRSDFHDGGEACLPDVVVPFVGDSDGELDPVDALLDVTEAVLDGGFGNPYANDGLVRAESARHGEFWGCVPADHLDQVGQLFGDSPGLGNDWDYQAFYSNVVNRIRAEGF
jgi:triacylglycerol lipase